MTVGEGGARIPDFTSWLVNEPAQRFIITDGGTAVIGGRATHVVGLTPRGRGAPFTFARLWIDDADAIVRQFETTDANGSVRRVRIDAIQMNVPVNDAVFTFTPPAEVKVYEPEGAS